ncbi:MULTISPECIES: hypothetical protein [Halomonas]|uniref:hypothetical protein n=1 Tax=Halomonas TaxID=2745 RepID=UPI000ED3FABC|nr:MULTISPECIES: hypothetical protein [Halomonas]HCR98000.1 hypothetical protein [Halomonas sp.]
MSLITQKQAARTNKKGQSPEQALHREWERIVKLKAGNERLEDDLKTFEKECLEVIGPAEEQAAEAILDQTRHLGTFLSRKSLAQWQRAELMGWIEENLNDLLANPFCDRQVLEEVLQHIVDMDNSRLSPEQRHAYQNNNEDGMNDGAQYAQEDSEDIDSESFEALEEELFEEFFHQQQEQQQEREQEQEGQQSLQAMLGKSSVNMIFRRLARLLHPDRELDADLKQLRGEQMGRATHARDSNDLFTLFSMYEEHVGESPLADLGDDKKVLKLLKSYSRTLREQRDDIINVTPIRAGFYQHFYDAKPEIRKRKLQEYCKKARDQAKREKEITHSIRSIATLKPHLEERYDMGMSQFAVESLLASY